MPINSIIVERRNNVGFNVKYCDLRISMPNFTCGIHETDKLAENLQEWNCNEDQINHIIDMIRRRVGGTMCDTAA